MFEKRIRGPQNTVDIDIKQLYLDDVMLSISILDKVKTKYNQKRLNRSIANRLIKSTKYFDMFVKILVYLVDLKGPHSNSINGLLFDYFDSIHQYYKSFGRTPFTNQLSPSSNNTLHFEDWITDQESDEPYWTGGRIFVKKMVESNKDITSRVIEYSQLDPEEKRALLKSRGLLIDDEYSRILET